MEKMARAVAHRADGDDERGGGLRELLGGGAGEAPCGLRSWLPGANTKLAGDHQASLKVLQVEFRCTSEGTRCSKRCGCPVLQCLVPGGQRSDALVASYSFA